ARHPGTARTRQPEHHAALHARERRAVARRLSQGASARAKLTAIPQPPLTDADADELTVAVASPAIGGAAHMAADVPRAIEQGRSHPGRCVRVVVLRDDPHEWPVPSRIRVTRLGGGDVQDKLTAVGESIARNRTPVCVCHLLTLAERDALAAAGTFVVPVVHN